jgi:uncharacterized protein YndB with AHSA1/START domain
MNPPAAPSHDPELDLVLERVVDVPPRLVWEAWTRPEHLREWFVPRPWTIAECEIDLRPGGIFRTVMRSPEGELHPNDGCYLEVIPRERLVWTAALLPGYRPAPESDLSFSCVLTFRPEGEGTRYRAVAIHRDPEGKRKHEEMGFHEGWGTALDQLVEYARGHMG